MSLNWYLNRLKTMSVPELGYRSRQFIRKETEKRRALGYFPEVQLLSLPESFLEIDLRGFSAGSDDFHIFGIPFDVSGPIDWHRDIRSQNAFPRTFARDIDIRSDRHGSAKHVWEVNRMQFLTRIARQYRASGDERQLALFQAIIESWIEANPYLVGVNWYSNIEVNLRLITWYLCWEILEVNQLLTSHPGFGEFVMRRWVPEIYLHCLYSHQNPSKFSSANNHLISEAAGLFIAASFWKFAESEKWRIDAKALLEQEIFRQHSRNGINKEEAAEYIQFISDFFLLAYRVGERSNNPFSRAYRQMLQQIFEYIYQLMDMSGNLPFYGDGDDGRTFILESGQRFNNFRSLLTSAAILFQEPRYKVKSNGFDAKNAVLFGPEGRAAYEALAVEAPEGHSRCYSDEGHFIFRKAGQDREISLHFDAAPLGFLSIAAHGHADALSFTLSVDGRWIFIDPGTYCYHSDLEWRQYFIGTLAHNTIRVDGANQALNGGPTLWTRHYRTDILYAAANGSIDAVRATHDGYQHLGVAHTREIRFDKAENRILILDTLDVTDRANHVFEIPFHLHPEVAVEALAPERFRLNRTGGRAVHLQTDARLSWEIKRGCENPILGWYSPAFYEKQPCPVIYGRIESDQSFEIHSEIVIDDSNPTIKPIEA